MPRMLIVVDVPDENPAYADPHDIAENVLGCYDDTRDANGKTPDYPEVTFVSAEWQPDTPAAPSE